MNESRRESESDERGHPGRRSEVRRKCTKYSIAVERAGLAVCFHLKNWEENK